MKLTIIAGNIGELINKLNEMNKNQILLSSVKLELEGISLASIDYKELAIVTNKKDRYIMTCIDTEGILYYYCGAGSWSNDRTRAYIFFNPMTAAAELKELLT
jgi:hypothetical protein